MPGHQSLISLASLALNVSVGTARFQAAMGRSGKGRLLASLSQADLLRKFESGGRTAALDPSSTSNIDDRSWVVIPIAAGEEIVMMNARRREYEGRPFQTNSTGLCHGGKRHGDLRHTLQLH